MSRGFAVAAGSPTAAEAGAEALRAGGTAVDAVIAAALAACAAEPVLAGLMGGGFLMLRPVDGPPRLLDGFVRTPRIAVHPRDMDLREAPADFGGATQAFHIGAGSVATPGLAGLLAEAHARFGRLPFADLARPAVEAARRGVPLAPFQARVLKIVEPIYQASPAARALFCGGADRAPEPGWVYRNPELADVIETFAAEGARFLTEGEPAAALAALCAAGGGVTAADLRANPPEWRAPLMRTRGAARVALNPPPAMGGALVALALDLLGPRPAPGAVAAALAAVARARAEDAEAPAARLLDSGLLARLRAELAARPPATRGTTHVSAVDAAGLGAALTLSNGEGCGLVLPGCGIMPNNMLGEADLVPEPGRWVPGVRPASMMAPTLVEWPDGRAALLGSGGSCRIRSAILWTALRLIDEGARLEDAIAAPRLHAEPEGRDMRLDVEDSFGEAALAALRRDWPEAQVWAEASMFFGGVHAVARGPRGDVEAAGDPRRDGVAIAG